MIEGSGVSIYTHPLKLLYRSLLIFPPEQDIPITELTIFINDWCSPYPIHYPSDTITAPPSIRF